MSHKYITLAYQTKADKKIKSIVSWLKVEKFVSFRTSQRTCIHTFFKQLISNLLWFSHTLNSNMKSLFLCLIRWSLSFVYRTLSSLNQKYLILLNQLESEHVINFFNALAFICYLLITFFKYNENNEFRNCS